MKRAVWFTVLLLSFATAAALQAGKRSPLGPADKKPLVREEAEDILRRMIRSLEQISDRSDGQNRQLEEARELLEQL